jgi:uncharacterized repeat protein (TIGR01451 family)
MVGLATATIVVCLCTVAGAAPVADGPQLSISVDNGKTSVGTGDTLDYTVTLETLGGADVAGLRITQTMPSGMAFGSADVGGIFQNEQVKWDVDLAKGATAVFHTTATVGVPEPQLLRLATVACANESEQAASPIVCASHSDQLPAGAEADAESALIASTPASDPGISLWWSAGIIVAIALVALAAILLIRRVIRRKFAEPPDQTL